MDNNEVYALFEDIKNGLKGINDQIREHSPKGLVRQFCKGASFYFIFMILIIGLLSSSIFLIIFPNSP